MDADGPNRQLRCHLGTCGVISEYLPTKQQQHAQGICHYTTCLLNSNNLLFGQGTNLSFGLVSTAATVPFPFKLFPAV